jgi:hypothetical protein
MVFSSVPSRFGSVGFSRVNFIKVEEKEENLKALGIGRQS